MCKYHLSVISHILSAACVTAELVENINHLDKRGGLGCADFSRLVFFYLKYNFVVFLLGLEEVDKAGKDV